MTANMVRVIMHNHVYRFGGKCTFLCLERAIGLELTGTITKVPMDKCLRMLRVLVEANNIKRYLCDKYVDDVDAAVEALRIGTRWDKV